jgi:hypothetical protein
MTDAIDWPGVLSACARLGLAPHHAWSLSMMEWRALTGPSRPAALPRAALDALIDRFPDPPTRRPETP